MLSQQQHSCAQPNCWLLLCRYRGAPLLSHKWMLQSVVGECSSDALPAHPSPSFPPEAVVEAQIQALRYEGSALPSYRLYS